MASWLLFKSQWRAGGSRSGVLAVVARSNATRTTTCEAQPLCTRARPRTHARPQACGTLSLGQFSFTFTLSCNGRANLFEAQKNYSLVKSKREGLSIWGPGVKLAARQRPFSATFPGSGMHAWGVPRRAGFTKIGKARTKTSQFGRIVFRRNPGGFPAEGRGGPPAGPIGPWPCLHLRCRSGEALHRAERPLCEGTV